MVAWMHISDWHQRGADLDRETVLESMLDDIKDRSRKISPSLSKIDFVIFSGDLAFSGQKEEYESALVNFINPLLECLGLPKDRFFIVPGNHDVDRSRITEDQEAKLRQIWDARGPAEFSRRLNNMAQSQNDRQIYMSKFQNYRTFIVDSLDRKFSDSMVDPAFLSFHSFAEQKKRVAIICLNSAWLSGHNRDILNRVYDYGYLCLSEWQVATAVRLAKRADLVIAVMHHPLSWITDFDRNQADNLLNRNCHFILHGHQHVPSALAIDSTIGDVFVIPAGASYQERFPADPRHVASCNFTHLDIESGRGAVHFRRWLPTGVLII